MSWSGTFSYSWNPPPRPSRITTSRTELLHIGIAYVVLTFDLMLIISGSGLLRNGISGSFLHFAPTFLLVAAGAALTGFLMHEMAHKIAAQRRGFWAEFRIFPLGLLLSLMTAYVGFLFAAPGATMVGGISEYDTHSWGRTSLAGPMSNVAFSAVFYIGALATVSSSVVVSVWLLFLAFINAWFGTFNLIPIGPLDGRKVLRWSPAVWIAAFAGTAAVTVVSYIALYVTGPTLGL